MAHADTGGRLRNERQNKEWEARQIAHSAQQCVMAFERAMQTKPPKRAAWLYLEHNTLQWTALTV